VVRYRLFRAPQSTDGQTQQACPDFLARMVEVASMELGLEAVVVRLKVYDHRNVALMVPFEDLGYGPRLLKAL
jgi:hypothetical protein